jgi:hypothetical protein
MQKLKYMTVILIVLMTAGISKAQELRFGFDYKIASLSGAQKNFIDATSYAGASFSLNSQQTENAAITFEIGYNSFYQKKNSDTYSFGTVSLTGVQYRYLTSVPVMVGVNYGFLPDGMINPYIGFGGGFVYNEYRVDMGLYSISDEAWKFAIRPEAGLLLGLGNTDLKLAASFLQNTFNGNEYNVSFFNYSIGFVKTIQ